MKVLTHKNKLNRTRDVVWWQILMDKDELDEPRIKEADSMNEDLPDYDMEGFYLSDEEAYYEDDMVQAVEKCSCQER
uniref:Uncharacterized protein n=1 Tax=Acrobeloides nanus TaxID=290746 RepID=A0A914DYI6_9BILA